MLRALVGVFVIAHGLVTFGIWAAPVAEKAPFNPSHSWLLGDTRTLAIALAVLAAIAFVVTGGGFLAQQDWWAAAAVAAGAVAVLSGLGGRLRQAPLAFRPVRPGPGAMRPGRTWQTLPLNHRR